MNTTSPYISANVPGPWAVDNRFTSSWAIVHTGSGKRRVVGPAGRMGRGNNRTNFFDKAMTMADDRNRAEATKEATK